MIIPAHSSRSCFSSYMLLTKPQKLQLTHRSVLKRSLFGTLGLVFLFNEQFNIGIPVIPEDFPDSSHSRNLLLLWSLFYFMLHGAILMLILCFNNNRFVVLLFCVHVTVWLCACACVVVHAHIWRPENNIRHYSLDSIPLCLETRVFHGLRITQEAMLSSRDLLISSSLQSLHWNW